MKVEVTIEYGLNLDTSENTLDDTRLYAMMTYMKECKDPYLGV